MRTKKKGSVYILSNTIRSVLYIGVTADLKKRIWRHRQGRGSKFTTKYKCTHLIYFEEHATILEAIEREKQLKNWNRAWKLELIRTVNPHLRDLWGDL